MFIAIGANLPRVEGGNPLDTCRWAAVQLAHLPGLRLAALSRWFRTRPVPASDQPGYVNGVAQLDGIAEPSTLLAALQAIEASAGRVRTVPNAARTLDLDIVAMGGLVRTTPDPVLPHPRMHGRAFVLAPLHDLAPRWRHPVLGQTVAELLQRGFPDEEVTPVSLRAATGTPMCTR